MGGMHPLDLGESQALSLEEDSEKSMVSHRASSLST
jgi:hypothetical protein